jgi:hypothetical protein
VVTPLRRYFAIGGVFASSPTDTWPSVESVVNALPPLTLWSPL